MTESKLGGILKNMYDNAHEGEKVVNIHLFGIKYASIISDNNFRPAEIVRCSGLSNTYTAEVSKGMKLSNYVIIK